MFTRSLFVFAGANAAISAFRQALSGRAFTLVDHSLRPSSPFPLWAICSCYSCSPMGQVLIQIHGVVKHANHLEHLVCRHSVEDEVPGPNNLTDVGHERQ
uniref:Putative plasmid stabilization protein SSB n=1 Tax=Pseudomonas aeruginosa TaxID=287 RepID=G8CNX5_PSEAI|nr:putative plasmid stabilization protein SSB [Pseudomonas aeruginosa]